MSACYYCEHSYIEDGIDNDPTAIGDFFFLSGLMLHYLLDYAIVILMLVILFMISGKNQQLEKNSEFCKECGKKFTSENDRCAFCIMKGSTCQKLTFHHVHSNLLCKSQEIGKCYNCNKDMCETCNPKMSDIDSKKIIDPPQEIRENPRIKIQICSNCHYTMDPEWDTK